MTATITAKYAIGTPVFWATTYVGKGRHECPDCRGTRKWKATSPAGSEYEFGCPRCSTQYRSEDDLSLDYARHEPVVKQLTIGSIQTNSADKDPIRYMCKETGIGSGTVYRERDLYLTHDEAMAAATEEAALSNVRTPWIAKQYNQSLSVCDYQIENAALVAARAYRSVTRAKLEDLFFDLRNCDDHAQAMEIIEAFSLKDES